MSDERTAFRGRGAVTNPSNRFETIRYERDPENAEDAVAPETVFLRDPSRTIITTNDSPDVGFDKSINPYRGCEHGCIYCFARPTHEFLGFSSGLDFETRIMVKESAPELLERELSAPSWRPQVIAISGVTDAYQPIERKLGITRRCLEVLVKARNPVIIITKSHLVTRDIDLLSELAKHEAAGVFLSITTLDPALARILEPRASVPQMRLDAVEALAAAGIRTGVMVAPVLPAINDHEIPAILAASASRGARYAGYTVLRLPYQLKSIFEAWLEEHFPERKEKVLNRIRDLREGELNDPRWGSRLKGEGVFAEQVANLFKVSARKAGITGRFPELSTSAFRRPGEQLGLFG